MCSRFPVSSCVHPHFIKSSVDCRVLRTEVCFCKCIRLCAGVSTRTYCTHLQHCMHQTADLLVLLLQYIEHKGRKHMPWGFMTGQLATCSVSPCSALRSCCPCFQYVRAGLWVAPVRSIYCCCQRKGKDNL